MSYHLTLPWGPVLYCPREAFLGGAGFPAPLALLGPVVYEGFVETAVSLALVEPQHFLVSHIGLLSAVRWLGRLFLSFGPCPPDINYYILVN